jgi:hypothetical protein
MLPTDHQKSGLGLLKSLAQAIFPTLSDAYIHVTYHGIGPSSSKIKVQYNPEELTLSQSAVVDGTGNKVFFHRTEPDNLVVSLVFDTYEARTDVRAKTDQILALTQPQDSHSGGKVPPTVQFIWDDRLFTGAVVKVDQKFTMFLPSGIPVRADLTVTFKEVLTDKEELDALGLEHCRRLLEVSQGDTLGLTAYKALGDRKQWRLIADANGIYDPISFPQDAWIGRTIAIPDTHDETFEPSRASDYV